jgi:plasmid maintenance system antidote protein VapI
VWPMAIDNAEPSMCRAASKARMFSANNKSALVSLSVMQRSVPEITLFTSTTPIGTNTNEAYTKENRRQNKLHQYSFLCLTSFPAGHILVHMRAGHLLLREWIDRSKLQDQQAAELLKIHRSFLSRILGGTRLPTLTNACHFEEVTGVPVRAWVPMSDASQALSGWVDTKRARLRRGK